MSASLTSGTYGHQPAFTAAFRKLVSGLFSAAAAGHSLSGDYMAATTLHRKRLREANGVRELARSVERTQPGFAADLYSAATRHEDDTGRQG